MRILLLTVSSRTFFYDQAVIPFGLLSLWNYIAEQGHTVRLEEMNSPSERIHQRYLQVDDELMNRIRDFQPDVVGMSTYASNIHNALFWAGAIRAALPRVHIVLGGNHASYIAEEILSTSPAVDSVIRFEGEKGFAALCQQLASGQPDYAAVPNLVYRSDGEIRENEIAPPIMDLNSLPPLTSELLIAEGDSSREQVTHADMITARGCPYNCVFCNCNHYWRKKYRAWDPAFTIENIKRLKNFFPNLQSIRFRDEAISIHRKHCLELCRELADADLGLRFQAHSRLDGLDAEVIEALSAAGFDRLYIGIESGSRRILEAMRKEIDIGVAPDIYRQLREKGIKPRFSFIAGTPGEELDDARQTAELIRAMGVKPDEFYFNWGYQVYPGTGVAEEFLRRFPDYRWLQPAPLGQGYEQYRDTAGNPLNVLYFAARYSWEDLLVLLKEVFADSMRPYYGPVSYYPEIGQLPSEKFHAGSSAWDPAVSLLQQIDAQSASWGVMFFGSQRELWEDGLCLEEQGFQHLDLVLRPEEIRAGDTGQAGRMRDLDVLVLAMSDSIAKSVPVKDLIFRNWKRRGETLLLEKFCRADAEKQKAWLGGSSARTALRLYHGNLLRNRVGRALRKIGLFDAIRRIMP